MSPWLPGQQTSSWSPRDLCAVQPAVWFPDSSGNARQAMTGVWGDQGNTRLFFVPLSFSPVPASPGSVASCPQTADTRCPWGVQSPPPQKAYCPQQEPGPPLCCPRSTPTVGRDRRGGEGLHSGRLGAGEDGGQVGNWMEKCPPLPDVHLLDFYNRDEGRCLVNASMRQLCKCVCVCACVCI